MNFDDIFAEYDNAPVQEKHPPPRVHLMRAMEAGGTPLPAMQAGSAAAADGVVREEDTLQEKESELNGSPSAGEEQADRSTSAAAEQKEQADTQQ